MATRYSGTHSGNGSKLNPAERRRWAAAYYAALNGLIHRKTRPTLLSRLCEVHADAAVEAYRRRMK